MWLTETKQKDAGKVIPDKEWNELMCHIENMSLIDAQQLKTFDQIIQCYCLMLHKWNLNNKRLEIFEFMSEKPADLDNRFGSYRYNSCRLFSIN